MAWGLFAASFELLTWRISAPALVPGPLAPALVVATSTALARIDPALLGSVAPAARATLSPSQHSRLGSLCPTSAGPDPVMAAYPAQGEPCSRLQAVGCGRTSGQTRLGTLDSCRHCQVARQAAGSLGNQREARRSQATSSFPPAAAGVPAHCQPLTASCRPTCIPWTSSEAAALSILLADPHGLENKLRRPGSGHLALRRCGLVGALVPSPSPGPAARSSTPWRPKAACWPTPTARPKLWPVPAWLPSRQAPATSRLALLPPPLGRPLPAA